MTYTIELTALFKRGGGYYKLQLYYNGLIIESDVEVHASAIKAAFYLTDEDILNLEA